MVQMGIADHMDGPPGYSFTGGRRATQPIGGYSTIRLHDASAGGGGIRMQAPYSTKSPEPMFVGMSGVDTVVTTTTNIGLDSTFRLLDQDKGAPLTGRPVTAATGGLTLPPQRNMPGSGKTGQYHNEALLHMQYQHF